MAVSTSRYELLNWIDIEKLDWDLLSRNKNAIDLLRKYPDKINWTMLSGNPNAFELLIENPEKINWDYFASNQNPLVIPVLIANPDKINWDYLSGNPNAIDLLTENQEPSWCFAFLVRALRECLRVKSRSTQMPQRTRPLG